MPTRLFRPSDYGVPTLGLTYLTRQELVDKDASALERFVKATLRGIEDARDNPEAATDIVMKFAPSEERDQQLCDAEGRAGHGRRPGLAASAASAGPRPSSGRRSTTRCWRTAASSKPVTVDTVFTDRILQAVYKDGTAGLAVIVAEPPCGPADPLAPAPPAGRRSDRHRPRLSRA